MIENVLPNADQTAEVGEPPETLDTPADQSTETPNDGENVEKEAKPEKTPEQRELDRARKKIDRLVRQREELRAQLPIKSDLRSGAIGDTNRQPQDDSEPLTLTRAKLQQIVQEEAARLAPAIREQQAEVEHRQKVVASLAKSWGRDRFDELADDLDRSFGGLADAQGRPKPATDCIFEADDPAALIEYLADPENDEEAEAIGRMNDRQAGRAIARLEAKISADKAKGKPQASKAAAPLQSLRGGAQQAAAHGPNPSDTKAWIRWRNEQERKGL